MTSGCMLHLKALHFPDQLPDLHASALAAKIRVFKFENVRHGGLYIRSNVSALQRMCSNPNYAERCLFFRNWLDHLYCRNIDRAVSQFTSSHPDKAWWLDRGDANEQSKVGFQRRISEMFLSDPSPAHVHIRRRLDRWSQMQTLPGIRPNHFLLNLKRLHKLVPPRVLAAVMRVAFDGLFTAARFQQQRRCIFGCEAEDSTMHYTRCRLLRVLSWDLLMRMRCE
eukprot:TRINITY_DN41934_c0_g1_i1.p1 TRINITY_DN41934_c0_g1~~TRINITY_DN41934_c0_g1_i1.p1  ORF type:complete len:224 (+),score=0.97 TRINITY_DN41934_c0_g1_i1:2-673(+)